MTSPRRLGETVLDFFRGRGGSLFVGQAIGTRATRGMGRGWLQGRSALSQSALDTVVLIAGFWFSYLLRFEFSIPPAQFEQALFQTPVVVLVQLAVYQATGVRSFVWRYIGMAEVLPFARATLLSALPILALRLFLPVSLQAWRVPLSIIILDTGLAFVGLFGMRAARRVLYERYERDRRGNGDRRRTTPVLLVGAGQAGVMAAKEIHGRGDLGLEVVGFIDDDREKVGSTIQAIRVLGTTADLAGLVSKHAIEQVIITMAQASRQDIQRIVAICEDLPVRVRIIPGLYEILGGTVEVSRIRDVAVEDLLGREQARLDEGGIAAFLAKKCVLVTGAGGSIGSELIRQMMRFEPATVVMVDRSEIALFEIDREARSRWPNQPLATLLADVGDQDRMKAIFDEWRPQVVFHAAALKHVPLVEANVCEGVKSNVLATRLLADLASGRGVDAFVLISTDKAVNPTSVMGASKRVAELVIQATAKRSSGRFVAVRFGNVLGSSGSVVPTFTAQIKAGGPVTITDPDMVRYFMTPQEAASSFCRPGPSVRPVRSWCWTWASRSGSSIGGAADPSLRSASRRRHRHRLQRVAARGEALRGARSGQ